MLSVVRGTEQRIASRLRKRTGKNSNPPLCRTRGQLSEGKDFDVPLPPDLQASFEHWE